MPPVKPENFTTKSKHLMDRGKDFESFYTQNPQAHLPGLPTGMRMEHHRLGTWTTGHIPPELPAYVREYGEIVPCELIWFGCRDMRHFPVTQWYVDEILLPESVPKHSCSNSAR